MHRVENRVSSQILEAPIYTPVAALHGEIGASSVEGRDMKMKLSMKAMVLEYLLVQVSSISCNIGVRILALNAWKTLTQQLQATGGWG